MTEVSVYSSVTDWNNNNPVMRTRVEYNACLSFPFDELYKSLKFLYGKDCIIELTLM